MRQSNDYNPLDSQRAPQANYIGYKSAEFKSIEHSARGISSTPFKMVMQNTKIAPVSQSTGGKRSESVAAKLQEMMKSKNQPKIQDF